MNHNLLYYIGYILERFGCKIRTASQKNRKANPFEVFYTPEAYRINNARLNHLESLKLDLNNQKVLEVGAGIGMLTPFFLDRGCSVLSTDARKENIAEIKRKHPERNAVVLNLDETYNLSYLGFFDIIFCYGTLYHLSKPEQALYSLSEISNTILMETCVSTGNHCDVYLVRESDAFNQSIINIGCRPTRPWIMKKLKKYWGYAYVTKTQPIHNDFETDWIVTKEGIRRSVFVGSKSELLNDNLLEYLPDYQIAR